MLVTSPGSDWFLRAVNDVGASLTALLACVCCLERSRRSRDETPPWRLLGLSAGCWAIGGVAFSYYELVADRASFLTPVVHLAPLVAVPLAAGGIMSFLPPATGRNGRALLLIDAVIATSAVLFCSWALILEPVYESSRGIDPTARVLELTQALGVVLVLALVVLVNGRVPRRTFPLDLLGAGLACIAVSNSARLYLSNLGDHPTTNLTPAGWTVGYLLLAFAALRQRHAPVDASSPGRSESSNVAAYLSVCACVAIVTARAVTGQGLTGFLLWGTIGILCGLLARQLFAIREKNEFALELERQVAVRTAELRTSQSRLQRVIHSIPDIVLVVGDDGVIRFASPSAREVLAYDPDDLVGRQLVEVGSPQDRDAITGFLDGVEVAERTVRAEVRFRHRDGSWRFMELAGISAKDIGDDLVLTTRDITDRKRLEAQLRHQAFHDTLTGLPNRALFADRLEHALLRARRSEESIALLFIDLDDFKSVNDTLGHDSGDALLQMVSGRLSGALREGDTIARLGGDEFAILLEDGNMEEARALAERLTGLLDLPFVLDDRQLHATASIGLSVLGAPDASGQELMRNADIAMYDAKRRGKAGYRVFEQRMHEQMVERLTMQDDLRGALRRDEFLVLYQPQLEVASERLRGFEALVRWQHPDRGLLGPSDFVPEAEESGLITALGEWVLRTACQQLAAWDRSGQTDASIGMSINVSGRQLAEPQFVDVVAEVIRATGIAPGRLTLELTETVLLDHAEATIERLRKLKALGVRLAIDDFGTGYSSLSYLREFPVDVLKIDRSFVAAIDGDSAASELVKAMVGMGQTLRLLVVAEGIEVAEQAQALDEMGCRLAQGFYYGRPLPPDQAEHLLTRRAGGDLVQSALSAPD